MTALALSFVVTIVAGWPTLALLRRHKILDLPNARSLHRTPTPRGGGAAVLAGIVVSLVVSGVVAEEPTLLATAIGFGALGMAEDLMSLSVPMRLAAQLVVAAAVVGIVLSETSVPPTLWPVAFLAGLISIAGYTNAFNFMDGINGVSAAQAIVASIAIAVAGARADLEAVREAGLVVAGAAAAFLPYNFPRAHMFLGDVGSYTFGGVLSVLAVLAVARGAVPEAVLFPFAIYTADTFVTLVIRLRRGDHWQAPHRYHVYQRLVAAGWSHARTTGVVAALITVCAALGAIQPDARWERITLLVLLLATITFYLRLPRFVTAQRESETWPK